MATDTGEKFYAEFTDFEPAKLSEWVKENVIAHFSLQKSNHSDAANIEIKGDEGKIVSAIKIWLGQFKEEGEDVPIQFWGDSPAWDWILFCELFGGSFKRPANIHYMCMDLATVFQMKGYDPDFERKKFLLENGEDVPGPQHNALYDTLVTKKCYEILNQKWK